MTRITVNPGDPDGRWTRTLNESGLTSIGWREIGILAIPAALGLALALWALGLLG